MKNTYYDELSEERDGYVMKNEESGVEITCTERYVKAWEERGFKVIREGRIHLVEEK
ncbi:hypothetical protein MHB44_18080 [Lysinibacillus sp. FSL H8-0500]|uniref:hypothetical protein n=1 Tax=Lysinibacillus sp. FSL H8-0500 TaxID=2921393 RepID=UPI003100B46B